LNSGRRPFFWAPASVADTIIFGRRMKSLKSGWGAMGRDLNSGWNWQPRNQGWSLSLDDFHQIPARRDAADHQAVRLQLGLKGVVELVPVAVALRDIGLAVGRGQVSSLSRQG
jgi:hypothetical protein